jgi:hypothetical protein
VFFQLAHSIKKNKKRALLKKVVHRSYKKPRIRVRQGHAPVVNVPQGVAPIFNIPQGPAPIIHMPEGPAPIFNVPQGPAPIIHVPEGPAPIFNVPQGPAPIVHLPAGPAIENILHIAPAAVTVLPLQDQYVAVLEEALRPFIDHTLGIEVFTSQSESQQSPNNRSGIWAVSSWLNLETLALTNVYSFRCIKSLASMSQHPINR